VGAVSFSTINNLFKLTNTVMNALNSKNKYGEVMNDIEKALIASDI
jgi:hypothetical protein